MHLHAYYIDVTTTTQRAKKPKPLTSDKPLKGVFLRSFIIHAPTLSLSYNFFSSYLFHLIDINKGDHFFIRASAWEQDFDIWPIPGDIQHQYFQGEVVTRGKQGVKDWYRIKWESDKSTHSVYDDFFADVYWDLPNKGQLIDSSTWKKYTSQISITTHASGK